MSPSRALSWAAVSSSSSISSSLRLLGVATLPAGESIEELADVLGTGVLLLIGVGVPLPYVPKVIGVLLPASDVVLVLTMLDTFGVVTGVF